MRVPNVVMPKVLAAVVCLGVALTCIAQNAASTLSASRFERGTTPARPSKAAVKLIERTPLAFEPAPAKRGFDAAGPGYRLHLSAADATFTLNRPGKNGEGKRAAAQNQLRISLYGANVRATGIAVDRRASYSNYFLGNNPKLWRTHVPEFEKVKYAGIYPGIDLLYYGNQQQLEHDFIVHPGADPAHIVLAMDATAPRTVNHEGDLVITASDGDLVFKKPVAYQESPSGRTAVDAAYRLEKNGRVALRLGKYDRTRELVIDPVVVFSTFFGGNSDDAIDTVITTDVNGNVYLVGTTSSTNLTTTAGAYDRTCGADGQCTGGEDVYIAKFDPSGALLFSTYLGGSGDDESYWYGNGGVVVDSTGVYVIATTNSSDFPTTAGAYRTTLPATVTGDYSGAITKLDLTGSSLIYSSYFGGSTNTNASGLAVDASGNAFVAGGTDAIDFPVTAGAYQPTCPGACLVHSFVFVMNASGTGPVYSTYLGGTIGDVATAVSVDSSGNAYLAGYTLGADFPTTSGAFQTAAMGGGIFTSTDGGTTIASSISGMDPYRDMRSIAVDPTNNSRVLAGGIGKIFASTDNGATWTSIATNLPGKFIARHMAFNTTGSSLVAADSSAIEVSNDGGTTWATASLPVVGSIKGVVASPVNASTFWAYTGNGNAKRLLISTDAGASWTAESTSGLPSNTPFQFLAAAGGGNPALYGATSSGVFKSVDGGSTWAQIATQSASWVGVDPATPTTVWGVAYITNAGYELFRSTNSGGTWTLASNPPSPISTIAPPVTIPNGLYALAANLTIVKTSDGGNTWTSSSTSLPDSTHALGVNPSNASIVYAAQRYYDAYAAKFSSAGALLYSTYLASPGQDFALSVQADSTGNAVVVGDADSGYPTTAGAYNTTGSGSFITKLNSSGGGVFSTILPYVVAEGGTLDGSGNVWVTGYTTDTRFPLINPIQSALNGTGATGPADAFVAELNSIGSSLLFSTLWGGDSDEYGYGIAVDGSNNVFVAGETTSPAFPTVNASQPAYGGGSDDAWVLRLSPTATTTDLALTASVAPGTILAGTAATLSVQATNNDSVNTATHVTVNVSVPSGLAVLGLPGNCTLLGTNVKCSVGSLAPLASTNLSFSFSSISPGNYTINTGVNGDQQDPTPANNSASVSLTVNPAADLQFISLTDNSPIRVSGPLNLTASVMNTGPNDATGSSVAFTLPDSAYTLISNSYPGGCSQSGAVVTCAAGTLSSGTTLTATISVTPDPALTIPANNVSVIITTTAQVSSTTSDPNSANNSAAINSTVAHMADLVTTGAGPSNSVTAGSPVTFNVTVTNNGPDAANATVSATLPPGFTFVSGSYTNAYASNGSCTFASNVITCPVGSLPYSPASASISIQATAGSQLGFFSLGATASSSTSLDPVPLNNAAGATAIVALTANAQDALLFGLNSRGTIALLNTNLAQLGPEPPLFTAQPRYGPVVLPNGRIAFVPRSSYISVVDLSIGAEIDQIYSGPVAYPLALSPDGATLVAVSNSDAITLIDTTTFATTSVNLNGQVGDNPANLNDIGLHAPAIVGRNAYFNASGLLNGSTTNGIPVVVLNLDTQAISTIALPTTSRGVVPPTGGSVATPFTIVATPDGRYLVIARQDGTVIYDLTTSSVAGRETTTTATRILATYRDAGNPNAFAYQVTSGSTPVLSAIDLRTGSPTFGTIVATATTATPDSYFNKTTIQSDAIVVSGDGSKIFTSDTGGVITTVDVRSLLTGGGGAAVNTSTYPNQFSFLSMFGAMVDLTPTSGAPTVTSISPNSVVAGTTTTVTITGTNFAPDVTVFGGGSRVDPSEIVSVTPTQIQLQLQTSPKDAAGTFDVGVTNPNLGIANQQNISAVVRKGFTIQPVAGLNVNDAIAAVLGSNEVASIAPGLTPTEPPSPPFRLLRGSIAMTTDANYAFVPAGAEGVDVVALATGTHTIHAIANTGAAARVIRSVDPSTSAPVVYFTDGTTLFELDANPASATFGNSLSSIASGVPQTISNAMSIAADPTGRYVYVAESNTGLTPDQQVLIYDVLSGTRPASLPLSSVGASLNQVQMHVTPDGKYLVLQMSNTSQIGLFNLANPTAPVQTATLQGNIPTGYLGINFTDYLIAGDRLYALGTGFDGNLAHTLLEVFLYDPAPNNFTWLANYINDHLNPGPMKASSDGTRIYVSNNVLNEVDILDRTKVEAGASDALVGALGAQFGPGPIDVAYSPQAPSYGLSLTMTHTPEPVARTGAVTFVLTATNSGSADLTNVLITDTLPSGTTFVKTNPNCTLGSGTIACILNTIPGGQSVSTSITLLAPSVITGFTNTANVLATEVPSGATASNTVNVGNGADVSVVALASPAATTPGGTVTFTTTVTNNGPDNSGATVNETLPAGFTFVSATYNNPASGSGACAVSGQVVTCDVGSLPYSGTPTSATITLTTTAGTQLGLFSLAVQAVPQNNEVNPLDNTKAAPVIVAASGNAQDAYVVDDNATASILFMHPGSLAQFASVPFVMAEPRMRPVVMPNGRLLFTGLSYIGVFDLSIGAEITRIKVPVTGPYSLTPDGTTLVVPSRDSVVLVNTATFQTTTIGLNGLVGDDPSNTNDINLGTAVIANNKAYFNPTGLQMGSTSVGLPIVVVDLSTHAVSTLAFPTLSLAPKNNFEDPAAAATPDGHYLVALRRDGVVIFDLTSNTVALRNPAIAVNGNWSVAIPRTSNDPNVFAYLTSNTGVYQLDVRTGSPTFGQVIGLVATTTNVDINGSSFPEPYHPSLVAHSGYLLTDDFYKTVTITDTRELQTAQAIASTDFILSGIDLNSSSTAVVDFTPVTGAPTVTSISPSTITTDGGTVTVQGTNLASGAIVRIGQNAPLPATFLSSTQLQVTIPPGVPAQSAMDVIVTVPNTAADISQQNLSGILRSAFSVELSASVPLASPLVSSMYSNGVTTINRKSQFSAIAQSPLHEVQGAGAVTVDGGYLITPVSGDQINATTPVDGGIAITNLATGTTTIRTSPVVATTAQSMQLVSSINPNGGAPVMYLAATNDTYTDLVVEMIDANPASSTFGTVLNTVHSGAPAGVIPVQFGLAVTPDGRYVFAGGEDLNTGPSSYRVFVFDMLNQTVVGDFSPASVGAAQTQRLMTFAGGDLLMLMSNTGNIGAFDVTTTPGTAVLNGTMSGILPEGGVSLATNGFAFANNIVYVSGTATLSNGTTAPILEAFNFDKVNSNYSPIGMYTASPTTASGAVSVSGDGTQVYVTATDADHVQIFDQNRLVTNTPGAQLASFGTPFGPAQFVANTATSVPATDLELAMTASPNPVAVGGTLKFNFTISNNGPLTATNVVLTDTLPAGTSITGTSSISCGGATCSCNNASPFVCSVSSIGVSSQVTGTFFVTAPAAPGDYSSSASVVADQAATTTGNSVIVGGTAVTGADVGVSISQPANPVLINTPLTYTIVVSNTGQSDATSVTLLPNGGNNFATPSSVTTTQGTCASDASSCSLGTITAGTSATVTITTQSKYPGYFSVSANATAAEADPNPANNIAYQTTLFLPSLTAAARFMVPDRASGRIRQYAGGTNTEVATANEPTAGFGVANMAVMPNGRIGFTAQVSNYVSVVDFSIGKEIARIPIRARTLALTSDGSHLLVVNALADELDVVDTSTLAVVNQISFNGLSGLGDDPSSADVNAAAMVVVGSKVYLNPAGTQFNTTTGFPIIVIDLSANSAAVIPGSAVGRGVGLPNTISATPDGHYVVALRVINGQSLIIDATTDTVLAISNNFAPSPTAVAITSDQGDPRGYLAYITTGGAKTNVLDLRQGSATFGQFLIPGAGASGTTGITGSSAVLSPDGNRLYVGSATLSTTAPQVDVYDTSALLNSPATALIRSLHISDYVSRVFSGITDLSVPSGSPTISSVTPATVPYEQPTQITVDGANFSSDAKVRIGKGDLITPDSISPSQLLVTIPAQTPAGTQDLTVLDLNSASSQEQQLEGAVAAGAITVLPPAAFAPAYQVLGHDSGDGSVFQLSRASAQTFVNQIALVPGAASPDGSTLWVPVAAGLLPYNFDTQSGNVVTGIPNSVNVGGIATGIDPVSSHAVVYLSTESNGASGDPMLEIIDAAPGSPTYGQVLRTINANLNDGSFAWAAAVTPDGRYIYSALSTATTFNLVIYDAVNGTATILPRSSVALGTSSVLDLRISPDGQRLIATDSAGAIAVLDVGTNPLAPARVGTLTPAIPTGVSSVSFNNYVITANNYVFALDGTQNIVEVFNFNCGTNPCPAIGTYKMGGMAGDFPSGALAASPDGSLIYALGFRSNVMTVLDPNLIVAANPNPIVAKLAAGVAPSGPAVTSRAIPNNDLGISLVAPTYAGANGNYTYQITIHNGGAATATGVTVLQQLPATFVSSSISCSGTSSMSCNVGSIAAGTNAVFTVTAQAPSSASAPLHTIATVSANENDSNPANNTATGDTTVTAACAPTTGYDKAWTGTVSSNWNDAKNWTPGGVPTSTNNVFVCLGAPNEPALSATAATQDLLLETGATVSTNGFTLTAAGSVNAGSITGTGTLAMNGSGVTLQGTIPNLTVNGSVSLAGATTATGATVVNGTLTVNGQTLNVPTLTVQGATDQASLVLTNASDAVNVAGNLLFETQHESGNITAGTLTVGGNFTLCCSGWAAYPGSGTNAVVLNGTAPQTITFASPNVTLQAFQDLIINNSSGVTLANNINVNGTLTVQSGTLSGTAISVTASNVNAAPGTTVNLATLSVSGTLAAAGANYVVGNTVFTGAASQLIPLLAYQNVTVNGAALLTGVTTATGNVTVNGTLTVNGQTLNSASLTVQGATNQASLVLTNASDAVNVTGDVLFETQHETGNITAGTLTVGGNFTLCCNGWAAYPGSGTNAVVLNGTSAQTISFATPNASQQAFQDLTIQNAAGVNLTSNIIVNGTMTLQSGSLSGASQTVTAANVSAASGTTLNLAALSLSGTISAAGATYNVASTTFTGTGGIPALPYQSLTIDGTSQLTTTTTVTGPVLVNGSLTVNGQTLNAGSLTVQGPTDQASLILTNPADAVNVSGNVLFETQHETGDVSAGTLTVGGNFTLCCGGWAAYPATGTNTVVLNGTSAQSVTAASPNATLQAFQELVINNSAGVNLASNIVTNDTLTLQSGTLSGATASATVANVNAASGTTLNLGTLTFSGTVSAAGANYVVANTVYTGNNPLPVLTYQALTLNGTTQLAGPTKASGSVTVNGSLTINGQTLNAGSLTVQGPTDQASITMTNAADAINVTGNTLFSTQNEAGKITAGTLSVGGNFTLCCGGWTAYPAGGTNTVVLNGTAAQTLSFATPSSTQQAFQNLVLNNSAGQVTLATNVVVNGTLNSTTSVQTVSGTGQSLATAGVNVTQMIFNDALLTIGAGPITQFNYVVFQNMPTTATQLTVQNPGSSVPLVFDHIQFLTTPVSPGLYVSATDTAPTDGLPLIIDFEHNTPSDGTPFTSVINGATVNWLASLAEVAMTGSTTSPVLLGTNETYTYTITNNGPDDAGTVTFTDAIPVNMTFVSANMGGTACTAPNNTILCTAASLASGGSLTVTVVLQPTAAGAFTNVATVSGTSHDNNTANNTVSLNSTVTAAADMSIAETVTPTQTQPGGSLTYTIIANDAGPADATGVAITDVLPIGVTLQSATSTQGTCSGTTTIACAIGTVTNGSTVTITVVVQVTGAGSLVNSVAVSANEADPVTTNNNASLTTASIGADLVLSVNAPAGVLFGQNQPYTFTIFNNGPNDAGTTTFTDTVPANMTFVSADIGGTPCSVVSGVITCSVASLAPSTGVNVNLVLHPTIAGTFTNAASVQGSVADTNPANNTISVTSTIAPDADLRITGSVSPQQVQPGTNITYTISVQNFGPSDSTGVVVSDTLSGQTSLVSATATQGSCSGSAPVTCSLGTIANGASATITIVVLVNTAGSLLDVATVSANEVDAVPANNSVSIPSSSIAADLAITTAAAGSMNGVPAYSATVTNNGPSGATGVTLTANLVRYTFSAALPSTCTFVAPTLTCPIGSMAADSSVTITIGAEPPSGGWSEIDFAARGNEFDPNPNNNSVRIAPPPGAFNTPSGSNVTVDTSDTGGSVAVTFTTVTLPGSTSISTLPLAANPPAGFRSGAAAVYYDVATTAQFTGMVGVALRFAPTAFHHPTHVRVFHMENGGWVDRTTSINLTAGTASAVTASLSPFALFEPVDTPPVANAGADFTVNGAATTGTPVALDGGGSSDADGDPLTYRWTGPFPEGGGTVTGVRPSITLPFGTSKLSLVVNDGELDSVPTAVNVTVSDFLVAPASPSASVQAGAAANYSIAVSPKFGAFNAPVTLSCGNLPAGMSCSFAPSTITPGASGGTSTLTISTSKSSAAMTSPTRRGVSPWLALTLTPFGFVLLGGIDRKRARWFVLALAIAILLLAIGCGGGSTLAPSHSSTTTAQPATTSTLTITATSGGVAHSTAVSITVQ